MPPLIPVLGEWLYIKSLGEIGYTFSMLKKIGFAVATFVIFGVMLFVGLVGILELLEVLQLIDDNPII